MPRFDSIRFSGGLNNTSKELIKPSEAQVLRNVDVSNGSLKPRTGGVRVPDPNIEELRHQDGNRSIVPFEDGIAWTDNETGEVDSTLGYVGITPADSEFRVSRGLSGDRLFGVFQYLIRFSNGKGNRSAPFLPDRNSSYVVTVDARQDKVVLDLGSYPDFSFGFVKPGDGSVARRNAVKVYPNQTIVNHNGDTWRAISNVSFINNIQGVRNAINAHAEPRLGHQFWRKITATSIEVEGFNSLILSNIPRPVEPVGFVEIYRTTSGGSDFFLNEIIPANQSIYEDFVEDVAIVNNDTLTDEFAFPPAYELRGTWERVPVRYLTKVNDRYWFAADKNVYHSLNRDIHSVNPSHVFPQKSKVTALWELDGDVIAWPEDHAPNLLVGDYETLTSRTISFATTQGNPNWRTTADVANRVVWQSHDGICVIVKGPVGVGNDIVVVTKGRYNFKSIANFCLGFKGSYYMFFDDRTVVLDFLENQIYELSTTADYGFASKSRDKMYVVRGVEVYTLEGGDIIPLEYKSPKLYLTSGNDYKSFEHMQVRGKFPFEYSIWYDDEKVIDSKKATREFLSLPSKRARSITVGFESENEINGFNIDFEVV